MPFSHLSFVTLGVSKVLDPNNLRLRVATANFSLLKLWEAVCPEASNLLELIGKWVNPWVYSRFIDLSAGMDGIHVVETGVSCGLIMDGWWIINRMNVVARLVCIIINNPYGFFHQKLMV